MKNEDARFDSENTENKDIYSELKGFFPEEYDLDPDELEQEIRAHGHGSAAADETLKEKLPVEEEENSIENAGEDEIISTFSDETCDGSCTSANIADETGGNDDDGESLEPDFIDLFPVLDETVLTNSDTDSENIAAEAYSETSPGIPDAEDVSNNALLNGYPGLGDLFDKMEDTGNAGEFAVQGETPVKNEVSDFEFPDDGDLADPFADSENNRSKDDMLKKVANWAFDFLEVFAVCTACIILFFSFVARLTRVDGISMNDTLSDKDYLVVSNLFYEPRQGDIVVLQNTSLELEVLKKPLVKRVIAVGGQTVDVAADGTVTVTDSDGTSKVLDNSFVKQETYYKGVSHCEVPEGYVFVMGDNRNNSTDSRDPRVGLVDERCIFGKAVMRVIPFGDFTLFENPFTN